MTDGPGAASTAEPTRRQRLSAIARRLGPYARPHRGRLYAALLASLAVTAAQLALPWPLRWIVDLAAADADQAAGSPPAWLPSWGGPLVWPVIALVVVGLVFGLSELGQRLAVARYVVGTVNDARVGLLTEAFRPTGLPPPRSAGDVLTRVVTDTARLRVGLKGVLVHVLQHGLFLLGVSVVLLALDVWLGLAYLGGLTLALTVAVVGSDRAATMAGRRRLREARAVDQALHRDAGGTGPGAKDPDRPRPVALVTQVKGRTAWVVQGVLAATACLVLTLAVRFAETGRLDTGAVALVSSYLLMLHYPMMRLGRQLTRLGPQLTSAERLAHLAEPPRPAVTGAP